MKATFRPPHRARGFTLIEVMIVVAIVAILAAVALPSYTNYLRRGQLQEAFTYLSDYRVKMEQYYQDNRSYGTGASGTACANATGAPTWANFAAPGARYFTFSCVLGADNQSYLLTATGSSGRAVGYNYRYASAGNVKSTILFAGAASTRTCWASTASDC